MVGNDVVDLGDRETQAESRHPRFDRRVFTADERRLVERSPDSNRVRWTLWACKESAFKLVKRHDPSTVFSPRAFEVTTALSGPAQVHFRGCALCVDVTVDGEAIHAVATWSRCDANRLISAVATTRSNPSAAVRELARQHLARVLACMPGDVEIVSGPDRIPELRIRGNRTPGFISLSHHGRFVAFACCLMPRPPKGV